MTPLIEASGMTILRPGQRVQAASGGATGALVPDAVLRDVDFRISAGEIVTVVGPNGSGKSSLIRALLGHMALVAGRVVRRGDLRIGYVPQRVQLDPALPMTVRRFLSLPRRIDDRMASGALARTGVNGLQHRQLTQLSGGQLQRVLLARALLHDPHLLVLDEPTQGLDQPGIVAFYQLIEEVRRLTGAAVLMVSHDLLVVMRSSDRVVCLNGHVCCEGTPQHVSAMPEYRALFGAEADRTLALYRHHHDHDHDHSHDGHGHGTDACRSGHDMPGGAGMSRERLS